MTLLATILATVLALVGGSQAQEDYTDSGVGCIDDCLDISQP